MLVSGSVCYLCISFRIRVGYDCLFRLIKWYPCKFCSYFFFSVYKHFFFSVFFVKLRLAHYVLSTQIKHHLYLACTQICTFLYSFCVVTRDKFTILPWALFSFLSFLSLSLLFRIWSLRNCICSEENSHDTLLIWIYIVNKLQHYGYCARRNSDTHYIPHCKFTFT